MSEQPTTITAKQFVDEGYAAKVAGGECVVISEAGFPVYQQDTFVLSQCDNGIEMIMADDKLTVTWLPQAQAAQPEAEGEELYGGHDSYVDQLLHELRQEKTEHSAAMDITEQQLSKLEAQLAALEHKAHQAETREKIADHMADVHEEQYKQEKDNATMLYRALIRNTPQDVYKPVIEGLFQSTNEYDKLMSEGSRWKEHHQRATWKIEELESQLAASLEREAALKAALKPFAIQYDAYLEEWRENDYSGEFPDYIKEFVKHQDICDWGNAAYEALAAIAEGG